MPGSRIGAAWRCCSRSSRTTRRQATTPGARRARPPSRAAPVRPSPSGRIVIARSDPVARASVPPPQVGTAWIALIAAAAIALHLLLRFAVGATPWVSAVPLYAALLGGGVPLLRTLGREILALELGADVLAGLSIVTAMALGEYLVATIVVLMLSGGTALEQYATRRASAVLAALARRMPRTAHRLADAGLVEVAVD